MRLSVIKTLMFPFPMRKWSWTETIFFFPFANTSCPSFLLPIKTFYFVQPHVLLHGMLPDSWIIEKNQLDLQIYPGKFFFKQCKPRASRNSLAIKREEHDLERSETELLKHCLRPWTLLWLEKIYLEFSIEQFSYLSLCSTRSGQGFKCKWFS